MHGELPHGVDPLLTRHIADGMVSNAVLPVPYGQPEAVLMLSSRKPGFFGRDGEGRPAEAASGEDDWPQPPFETFLSLGLEPLLVGMLRRIEHEDAAWLQRISDEVADARTVPEATRHLLAALVGHFGWHHAAVFAVEPREDGGRFRLFAQYPEVGADGSRHPLFIPPGYTQPLYDPPPGERFDRARARASGMLGAAIRERRPLVVPDTSERDAEGDAPHFYRSISGAQRSALTVPITLVEGRTRWVLDTISCHPNAFIEADGEPVGRLVHRLARRVANLRTAWLNAILIELIEQGVVVTDAAGTLLWVNERARAMLGLPEGHPPIGRRLAEHAGDWATRAWLEGGEKPPRLLLGPVGGVASEVRVSRLRDQTETRDVIWLLDGADLQNWGYDQRYIEETVQEVARQVRGPLLLASALTERLARNVQEGAGSVVERVQAEICKADITFERLAESIGAKREPRRKEDRVNLAALLRDVVTALPERDRTRITTGDDLPSAEVLGDTERLRFVLRNLLGHLLAGDPSEVSASVQREGGAAGRWRVRLRLAADGQPPVEATATGDADRLEAVAKAAREAADLAFETVKRVVRAHKGGVIKRRPNEFVLQLPLVVSDETRPADGGRPS